MALRHLKRVTCVALGHGQCECRPFQLVAASFCTTSTQKKSMTFPQRKQFPPAMIRMNSSVPNERGANHTTNAKTSDLSTKDKLKKLWKNYGIIAVSTYLGIYATTLGSIFLALDFDLFNAASVGLDPAYAIEKFSQVIETFTGNTSVPSYIRDHPSVGTFAIAWVMTKFTEPVRLGLTLISVPTVARWLGHKKNIKEPDAETQKIRKENKVE